ncbi:G5 domain-containing protein, partial [Streptococcus sp. HMSC067H01]|uniref:G5 domain-containing protein n=1 Tax=Streptococcus sp. HMSC067H01 TaxID=1739491 RepID=UPI0015D674A3
GQSRIVTEGVNGRRSHFYSVTTAADGTEVKTLVTSVVAQEPVAQVIEVGNPVTHLGDEKGQATIAENKPRVDIQNEEIPFTTITRET